MVTTPICDFAEEYARRNTVRLHMPGHKGQTQLGCEVLDITEIDGADDLFHADGIIAQSEANASRLFGCPTFYSTEGSSLCIRAMLFLTISRSEQGRPLVLAGRNAHKTFLNTAVLLDFDVSWLMPKNADFYHACPLTAADVESAICAAPRKPCAVYLTSPDYLGSITDIAAISEVCRKYGVLLLVDNAHGAYLKFLSPSRHPMDLGADLCCDSAHKTLPVLTGGAYLHVKDAALAAGVKDAMALFGSTSPSYLIMQSLDRCNPYLERLPEQLSRFTPKAEQLKAALTTHGYTLTGRELLKITVAPKDFGYTGTQLAQLLLNQNIVCEFHDPDHVVFMLTPENSDCDLSRLEQALCSLPRRTPIGTHPPMPHQSKALLSPRAAAFSPREVLPASQCLGRILAAATVSCPPAIPIVMCGEVIDEQALALFRYYSIEHCTVVK